MIAYYLSPYKPPKAETVSEIDLNENQTPIKLFDRKDSPRKTMRVLLALWYATHFTFENMYLKFLVTYMQYCPLQLSASKSAEIFSVASAIFTAFCGVSIFLRFRLTKIIYYAYGAMTLGVVLMVFGHYNIILLWISSVVICAGFAPMYAVIYAFADELLSFNDHVSASFMLLLSILTLVTPAIIGLYIEEYSVIFIIIEGFFFAISAILFIAIVFLIKKYQKKLSR